MKFPTIEEAANWSDEEIGEFLGTQAQIASFKQEIGELAALKGKAREEAERMFSDRLRPHISGDSLQWIKEDALRSTQKGKDALRDTSPSSIDY